VGSTTTPYRGCWPVDGERILDSFGGGSIQTAREVDDESGKRDGRSPSQTKDQKLMIEEGRRMAHGGMGGTKGEEVEVAHARGPEGAAEAAGGALSSYFVAP
jgi:hypothetical protein